MTQKPNLNEDSELWREHRRAQQQRRLERLPVRQAEIEKLRASNFTVKKLTEYQFRINDRLDLFPIHRLWHDIKTGKRGSYKTARGIADKILKP